MVSEEFYQKPQISENCTRDLATPLSAFESFIDPALTLLLEFSNIEMEKLRIKKLYHLLNPKNTEKAKKKKFFFKLKIIFDIIFTFLNLRDSLNLKLFK